MASSGTRTMYLRPWRIDVVARHGVTSPLPALELARAVARALDAAKAPRPGSVTVVPTDDEELADLNQEHMGHAGPTDVLSFPMLDPASFPATRRTEATRVHIGDIAISVERAIEQAEEGRGGHTGDVRWSSKDEMRLLVIHGTLHLCGLDHAEPAEEAAMRALETALLAT